MVSETAPIFRHNPSTPPAKAKRAASATMVAESDDSQAVQGDGFQPGGKSAEFQTWTAGGAPGAANGGTGSEPQGGCGSDTAHKAPAHASTAPIGTTPAPRTDTPVLYAVHGANAGLSEGWRRHETGALPEYDVPAAASSESPPNGRPPFTHPLTLAPEQIRDA